MYKLNVPFKDFHDKPRNLTIHFNLAEREVFRLLPELQFIMNWIESMKGEEIRELDTKEVVEFYTAFEELILEAYGEPSADGLYFDKTGKYQFESSAMFNAVMVMMVQDPMKVGELLDGIMPKDLQNMVKTADSNLAEIAKRNNPEEIQREIERLQALVAEQNPGQSSSSEN